MRYIFCSWMKSLMLIEIHQRTHEYKSNTSVSDIDLLRKHKQV